MKMEAYGILSEAVSVINILYSSKSAQVSSPDDDTEFLEILAGVFKRDSQAPCLFISALEMNRTLDSLLIEPEGNTREPETESSQFNQLNAKTSFVCKECAQSFSLKSQYLQHLKLHLEEKPFQCEMCGAAFSTSSNLAVHRRIHTRERPFQCEKCGDFFSQLSHLTRHHSKRTTENSFKCTSCPKMFGNAYHLKARTNDKPPEP